ncbi:MAG: phage holin family protein [Bacteroidaceae bacterium]|nr:phage holin family protein [Bacteroidaceae bacterium]
MKYLIVIGFIVGDIITGLIKAFYKEGLNSTILRKGLFHKLSEIITLFGATYIDYAMKYMELGLPAQIFNGVSIYICLMEIISISENISAVNPKLAKLLSPYLEKIKSKDKEDTNE